MSQTKRLYLSYILDENTPTYGNRNKFLCQKKSDMSKGDIANDSSIETTVHIGTHIDMPYHFYGNGQTIEDFSIGFWNFNTILFIEIKPNDLVIHQELINALEDIENKEKIEFLIVKTGICTQRDSDKFWKENPGFSPDLADYIRSNFPQVRVLGFDSISVSSFTNRMIGREAHKQFLNPEHPILLLEDMDLNAINKENKIQSVDIIPLRIAKCDGLPCTIIAEIE